MLQKLHCKLINCYKNLDEGELWRLPNDGYIPWFLLYHLFKARLYSDIVQVGTRFIIEGGGLLCGFSVSLI